jgi:hypothetical protein
VRESAAGRALPFGFGRQGFPDPVCVCLCVFEGDVGDGMISAVIDAASLAFWSMPARTGDVAPPEDWVGRNGPIGRREHS